MTSLTDLPPSCFEGVVPSMLATCSEDGVPNATWLSQIFLVDERHVALSCQFFRKTRKNLEGNPVGQALLVEPETGRQWRADIRFVRSESSGRTFSQMQTRLQAVASMTGNQHVFALRSADIFEVLAIEPIDVDCFESTPVSEDKRRDPLQTLARMTETIAATSDIGALVEAGLSFLTRDLGYESVGLYLFEESERVLYALASRGFARSGVGARIAIGVGIVGTCAERRIPIRIANTLREVTYGRAVKEQAEGKRTEREREIPLPGLDDALSLLAVPLLVQGRLFGVLATESLRPLAFDERDALLLTTAGQLVAQGIALYREDEPESKPEEKTAEDGPRGALRVRYYEADDSVFVDGEYFIKGLPGRILWLVLTLQKEEGRSTFQNRELRLHPFLKLPSFKDNLETRLLMLQRRLDDKGLPLRMHREQRGRLRLECPLAIELERIAT